LHGPEATVLALRGQLSILANGGSSGKETALAVCYAKSRRLDNSCVNEV